MRRLICGMVLGIVALAAIAPAGASWLTDPPSLVLHIWNGQGARPGLYYDKIEVQMHPDRPVAFYQCRPLAPVPVVPGK